MPKSFASNFMALQNMLYAGASGCLWGRYAIGSIVETVKPPPLLKIKIHSLYCREKEKKRRREKNNK
jgi:hypothetical protein